MSNKNITIGIPTYNREKIIFSNINSLNKSNFLNNNNVNLIVSDNCSSDNTVKKLESLNCKNLRIIKNKKNIGYTKNFLKVLENCNSKYLMFTSDEDFIIKKNINTLHKFLKDYNPTFVSTLVINNGTIYQGKQKIRKISLKEFNSSSFYLSGLIYDTKKTKLIIKKNRKLLTADFIYYPHSMILSELMILYPDTQYYFNKRMIDQKYEEKTFTDVSNNPYWTTIGRINSFNAIENYFTKREAEERKNDKLRAIKKFKSQNREDLYKHLLHSFDVSNKEIIKDFKYGLMKFEFGKFFGYLFLKLASMRSRILAIFRFRKI